MPQHVEFKGNIFLRVKLGLRTTDTKSLAERAKDLEGKVTSLDRALSNETKFLFCGKIVGMGLSQGVIINLEADHKITYSVSRVPETFVIDGQTYNGNLRKGTTVQVIANRCTLRGGLPFRRDLEGCRFLSFGDTYQKMIVERTKQRIEDILSDEKEIANFPEAAIRHNASFDVSNINNPPVKIPDDKPHFFAWNCKIEKAAGDEYVCSNGKRFVASDIKKEVGVIRIGGNVSLVGEYTENRELELVSRQKQTVPVLTNVYIFGGDGK